LIKPPKTTGDSLWLFWIALHCTLVRSPSPPLPHLLPVPLKAIIRCFIILFLICIWSPSTVFLHLLSPSSFPQVLPHTISILYSYLSLLTFFDEAVCLLIIQKEDFTDRIATSLNILPHKYSFCISHLASLKTVHLPYFSELMKMTKFHFNYLWLIHPQLISSKNANPSTETPTLQFVLLCIHLLDELSII
jgi:hypothetical protein